MSHRQSGSCAHVIERERLQQVLGAGVVVVGGEDGRGGKEDRAVCFAAGVAGDHVGGRGHQVVTSSFWAIEREGRKCRGVPDDLGVPEEPQVISSLGGFFGWLEGEYGIAIRERGPRRTVQHCDHVERVGRPAYSLDHPRRIRRIPAIVIEMQPRLRREYSPLESHPLPVEQPGPSERMFEATRIIRRLVVAHQQDQRVRCESVVARSDRQPVCRFAETWSICIVNEHRAKQIRPGLGCFIRRDVRHRLLDQRLEPDEQAER